MNNIKDIKIDKYNGNEYEFVGYNIYRNVLEMYYCFCFSCDMDNQSVLDDLLRQYSISVNEYGDGYVEVKTFDDSKKSLIRILNFSTIIDKNICNVTYKDKEILCIYYKDSSFICNGKNVVVPIYGYRSDRDGCINFDVVYPEVLFIKKLCSDSVFDINIGMCKYILLRDCKVYFVIYDDSEIIMDINFNFMY